VSGRVVRGAGCDVLVVHGPEPRRGARGRAGEYRRSRRRRQAPPGDLLAPLSRASPRAPLVTGA
jgi:hypothetical protein